MKSLLEDDDIREAVSKKMDKKKEADNAAENPELLEYGNNGAQIMEFYATDSKGLRTNSIAKGSEFTIHMKVKFLRDINGPIFAFTFKNIMGIEITGTNSMVEKAFLEPVKAGDEKIITFTQKMRLQGGDYLISFGVTGFEQDDFVVYHRLYDALGITVVSDKNTVGYFDMESTVCVTDSEKD